MTSMTAARMYQTFKSRRFTGLSTFLAQMTRDSGPLLDTLAQFCGELLAIAARMRRQHGDAGSGAVTARPEWLGGDFRVPRCVLLLLLLLLLRLSTLLAAADAAARALISLQFELVQHLFHEHECASFSSSCSASATTSSSSSSSFSNPTPKTQQVDGVLNRGRASAPHARHSSARRHPLWRPAKPKALRSVRLQDHLDVCVVQSSTLLELARGPPVLFSLAPVRTAGRGTPFRPWGCCFCSSRCCCACGGCWCRFCCGARCCSWWCCSSCCRRRRWRWSEWAACCNSSRRRRSRRRRWQWSEWAACCSSSRRRRSCRRRWRWSEWAACCCSSRRRRRRWRDQGAESQRSWFCRYCRSRRGQSLVPPAPPPLGRRRSPSWRPSVVIVVL